MRVRRCNSCRIEFEAVGPYEDNCPSCGSTVRTRPRYINDNWAEREGIARTTFNDDDLEKELYR